MRQTLLAVGFAVLVSMMLVPRAHWDAAQGWRSIEWWLPFLIDSPWGTRIDWQQLALQTVFLGRDCEWWPYRSYKRQSEIAGHSLLREGSKITLANPPLISLTQPQSRECCVSPFIQGPLFSSPDESPTQHILEDRFSGLIGL